MKTDRKMEGGQVSFLIILWYLVLRVLDKI